MVELSPEAKRLLAQLRDVDDPTPEERSNAHAAARRALQAQGLRKLPRLPAVPPLRGAARTTAAAGSGSAVKLVWGAVATLGLLATLAWRAPLQNPSVPATHPVAQNVHAPEPAVPPAPAEAPIAAPPAPAPTPVPAHSQPPHEPTKSTRAAGSSLAAELRFLSMVDAEIRDGAFDSALQRLDHHKGGAQLQEERAALRVLALCGRDSDRHAAHARAKFLKGSPSSVLAARVQAACAGVGIRDGAVAP